MFFLEDLDFLPQAGSMEESANQIIKVFLDDAAVPIGLAVVEKAAHQQSVDLRSRLLVGEGLQMNVLDLQRGEISRICICNRVQKANGKRTELSSSSDLSATQTLKCRQGSTEDALPAPA